MKNFEQFQENTSGILYYLSNFSPVYLPRLEAISFSCFRIVLELLVEFLGRRNLR